ncbi:O-antigen ligase family protein [Saccharospirillum sp. HFRX-1]|uniref:O-antigen ligase family protein n=1 Tax=unclassified Saccharospirillum TaxID=2633430 RepID=UPI00371DBB0D
MLKDYKNTLYNAGNYFANNWPEFCLLFFIVLYPFGEIMHVALLPFLYFVIRQGVPNAPWVKPYLALASLFLIPLLLSAFTAWVLKRHLEIIFQWVSYVALGLALIAMLRHRFNENLLLYGMAALVMFAALDGLMQFFVGYNVLGNPLVSGRVVGVFYPHLKLSVDLAHLSPFVFEAIRRYAKPGGWRSLAWLMIVPLAFAIFLGGNRSGWLVFFVFSVLYVAYLLYRREFPLKTFFLVSTVTLVAVFVAIQTSSSIERQVDKTLMAFSGDIEDINVAGSYRVEVFRAALAVIVAHPWLGVGESGFDEAVKPLGIDSREVRGDNKRLRHAHFHLLDVPLQTGVIGLVGYLLAFAWLVKRTWQSAKHPNTMAFAMAAGVAVAMMPINMHYSFYDVRHASLSLVFLMLSFVYLPASGSKSSPE